MTGPFGGAMRRLARGLVLLAAFAGIVGSGAAQDVTVTHREGERDLVSVLVSPFVGSVRVGGLGFALVDVQNQDGRPHLVHVQFESRAWVNNSVDVERKLMLEPHERGRFHLPIPNLGNYSFALTVAIDGVRYEEGLQASANRGPVALLISSQPERTPAVLGMAQNLWPHKSKREAASVVACGPRDVPNDWRLYTAFDLVVVDGLSPVGPDTQEALRRYVHAGGRLLVVAPDRLPPGVLRERLETLGGTERVQHGLGAMVATRALSFDTPRIYDLLRSSTGNDGLWPLDAGLLTEQEIPGLNRAPVMVFLLVILLFAVLVGPVNFLMLRRARRPMLALVTVPAIGFGTTLLMFGYAIVNDGFGVRGTVRSWSVLDQADREVATIATRTMFAGLSPGPFQLGDDSVLLAPAAFQRPDRRSRHRWSYDGRTGEIGGGVLPARTPTVLASARQGVVRERLRVQERADGDLDLLVDGGVVPKGDVILRDRSGRYWFGPAPRLTRIGDVEAEQKVNRLRMSMRSHAVIDDRGNTRLAGLDELGRSLLEADVLPSGSYLTKVASAPWLPEHGIAVDYEVQEHFVLGRLGPEDFVQ